ncbi:MAG: hypothetical protein HY774_24895 [Acidobacteria bacterium]|nr:hypothetical protein [Acidobacteriota bacterium]
MKKALLKPVLSIAVICLVTCGLSLSGFAQRSGGGRPGRGLVGQLTAIAGSQLTITVRDDKSVTVLVDENTQYRRNDAAATLADLQVNDYLSVKGRPNDQGQVLAVVINASTEPPQGGQGGDRGPKGDFVSANSQAGTLTLKVKDGTEVTIYTTTETIILRNRVEATLSDFQAGDRVSAAGRKNESGQFVAVRIMGGDAKEASRLATQNNGVFFGEVTQVSANSVTFINQDGIEQTVLVSEKAVITQKNRRVGLADLQAGTHINVIGITNDQGQFTATGIFGNSHRGHARSDRRLQK